MPGEKISLNGTHLMIDCFGCPKETLQNKGAIEKFLGTLPEILGMKKLISPYVVTYEGGETWDRGGITGFMLIAESHISIHTFPHDGFFTADVYSCKPFDVKKATDYFKETFESKSEKVNVVQRDIEIVRAKNLGVLKAKAKNNKGQN